MAESQNAPTVKANKGVRFYNAGDRFSEPINYTLPGGGDIHAVARWIVDADADSFFNVPTTLKLSVDGTTIPVDFPGTVLTRFKDRGVIMIDDEWEPSGDEDVDAILPFARDEKGAKAKGGNLWKEYLKTIVRNHIEHCQRARSMGGFPVEASGFTKRAFKLLNIVDPASQEFELLSNRNKGNSGGDSAEVTALRAELSATNERVEKMLKLMEATEKKKLDAAIEKQTAGKVKS